MSFCVEPVQEIQVATPVVASPVGTIVLIEIGRGETQVVGCGLVAQIPTSMLHGSNGCNNAKGGV